MQDEATCGKAEGAEDDYGLVAAQAVKEESRNQEGESPHEVPHTDKKAEERPKGTGAEEVPGQACQWRHPGAVEETIRPHCQVKVNGVLMARSATTAAAEA